MREFSFDYFFPGDEHGQKLTMIAGKERLSGMVMASVIPMKGTTGQFATKKCLDFIRECGAAEADIVVKTDQENAIVSGLIDDVVQAREDGRTLRRLGKRLASIAAAVMAGSKGRYWRWNAKCGR